MKWGSGAENSFRPAMGCGVGLRSAHYPVITETWPRIDWFEAISENYMDTGGRPVRILEKVRGRYPVALHGTALSIGSVDPLNQTYLRRLKALADRIDPFIVSDHLCWSGARGEQLHDLLPLPFTEEAARHVARRAERVQEFLGRRILLENVSTYVTYRHSSMPEWEFLRRVAVRSGCGILFDVNNLYVNAFNHGFDPIEYLDAVPLELVGQIHLAGHTHMGKYLFDTHSAPVIDRVWDLYREALRRWGPVSTLVEWDENIPPFEQLAEEARRARLIYDACVAGPAPAPRSARPPRHAVKTAAAGPVVTLAEVQRWMKSRIQPLKEGAAYYKSADFEKADFLNPQGGEPGEKRISVYAGGYLARLHESIAEVYETVLRAIGHEEFDRLCRAYAERHPSTSYNLNDAGKLLPDFIAGSSWDKTTPFLADLARFEWLVWEAFHAFDGPPFRAEDAAALSPRDWERARIVFQPSVRLFESGWPVLDMWVARREEAPKAENLRPRRQRVLIGRRAEQVRCEPLEAGAHRLIGELLAGRTLGAACARLAEMETSEFPVASWFAGWARDGLIARCVFPRARARGKRMESHAGHLS